MKKQLNFINYSNQSYNVLNNSNIDTQYKGYLNKIIDYENQVPQFKQKAIQNMTNPSLFLSAGASDKYNKIL